MEGTVALKYGLKARGILDQRRRPPLRDLQPWADEEITLALKSAGLSRAVARPTRGCNQPYVDRALHAPTGGSSSARPRPYPATDVRGLRRAAWKKPSQTDFRGHSREERGKVIDQ